MKIANSDTKVEPIESLFMVKSDLEEVFMNLERNKRRGKGGNKEIFINDIG